MLMNQSALHSHNKTLSIQSLDHFQYKILYETSFTISEKVIRGFLIKKWSPHKPFIILVLYYKGSVTITMFKNGRTAFYAGSTENAKLISSSFRIFDLSLRFARVLGSLIYLIFIGYLNLHNSSVLKSGS